MLPRQPSLWTADDALPPLWGLEVPRVRKRIVENIRRSLRRLGALLVERCPVEYDIPGSNQGMQIIVVGSEKTGHLIRASAAGIEKGE
jgi:hypothetical protein